MAQMTHLENRNRSEQNMEDRLVFARGLGGSGMDWEFGVSRCKLLHLGWISNEFLLCSSENCI